MLSISRLLVLLLVLLAPGVALGAPSFSILESGGDLTDQTTYTTGSHTVHAGKLTLFAFYTFNLTGAPAVSTISGHGCTWSAGASVTMASNKGLFLYRCVPGSDDTGTISVTFTLGQSRMVWDVIEVDGADTSGSGCAGGLVQCPTQTDTTGLDIIVTFAAYGNSNNRPLVVTVSNTVGTGSSSEAGWTELSDHTPSTEAGRMHVTWRDNTGDTTATVTYDSGTNADKVGIGVEVAAAPAGGGGGSRTLLGVGK